jgi:hypothetical protein
MEREEEGRITIKMIPDLTDIPQWKDWGQTSMSKHFRVFETYLSQHFGVKGFPPGLGGAADAARLLLEYF